MDSIKHKIFSLLQKTVENGCTEEEQQAAQAKAAELMASYGMEAGEALGRGFSHQAVKIPICNLGFTWIAKLFGCRLMHGGSTDLVFGRRDRVELAAYFIDTMYRQREAALRKVGRASNPKWNEQFRIGFAVKYYDRLELMYKQAQEYGLMVVELVPVEAAEKYFDTEIGSRQLKKRQAVVSSALIQGMEAGTAAEISRPLN